MATATPAFTFSAADDLLQATLAVSLTAINILRPVLDQGAEAVDFIVDYINPAGQAMVGLPEHPAATVSTLFPHAQANGLLDFYRRVYATGEPGSFDFNFADGEDTNFYLVAARRSGERLVVSLTDSSNYERTAAEQALRASQAREQQARLAAERERNMLNAVLTQAPVAIALFQGDEQVVVAANDQMCAIWGYPATQVLGRPLLEGVPELRGQGFAEQIAEVARSRQAIEGNEVPAQLARNGRLDTHYFNFVYQPLYGTAGELLGVLDIAVDVTEQVANRQVMLHLNEELAVTNEELQAANEEFLLNNEELARTQLQLQHLNQELEARVLARTGELLAAQAATEHQRQRLARFFSQAPAAICVLDGPDLVFELVNAAYQQLFPGRQLLGRPLLEALPELAGQPVWQTLRRVFQTGETHEETAIRVPVARYEGEPAEDFYFHYIQQARYDEQGRIDGVIVFALDMTEQVLAQQRAKSLQTQVLLAAQQQVRQREDLYQIFERTPAVIAVLRGPDHRLDYFNSAYQQIFPGRQMRGRTIAEVQPEAIAQGFGALLDEVYQTGETYYGHEVLLEVDDPGRQPRRQYLDFTYQAYQENGQTVGISVFAYDVTGQVLARRQWAASLALTQTLFEQAPVAIAIFRGDDYVVEVANPVALRLLGRQASQLLGRPLFEALPEMRDQGIKEVLDGVVKLGKAFVAQEVALLLEHDGQPQPRHFNCVYQPLRDEQGHLTGIAAVATDVSEQVAARQQVAHTNQQLRHINAELDAANQQLTRTNVDLDNFIYTASHDLKAPITNIEGLLSALQEQLPPAVSEAAQAQPLLLMMQGAIERFQKTIANLTDISKLQQAHAQPAELIDLAALVEDIRLDLGAEMQAAGARLVLDVEAHPTVSFAPKNLRSIVYNLLSNAVKYRAPGRAPLVQLRSRPTDGPWVLLEITDNGLGLDEAQQGQLFQMFRRLHSHVEGSGIGLYMVKKIVENAGGNISVHSEPHVGTTFRVLLPA